MTAPPDLKALRDAASECVAAREAFRAWGPAGFGNMPPGEPHRSENAKYALNRAASPTAILAILDRLEAAEAALRAVCDEWALSEGIDAADCNSIDARHAAAIRLAREAQR